MIAEDSDIVRHMTKGLITYLGKLEAKIHAHLAHHPVLYAFIGGTGVILFWKGVWETAGFFPILHGPGSILLGAVILVMTGLVVSVLIGNSVILAGFKHEEKLAQKTEHEVRSEEDMLRDVERELARIEEKIDNLEGEKGNGA
jgi:hypothetical protein